MDIAEYVVRNSQKRRGTNGLSIVSAPTTSTGNAANCPPFIERLKVAANIS